jgi:hypothetical protein
LGIADVWDERNGLLWAQPFEKVSQMVVSEIVAQTLHFCTHRACLVAGISCARDSRNVSAKRGYLQVPGFD